MNDEKPKRKRKESRYDKEMRLQEEIEEWKYRTEEANELNKKLKDELEEKDEHIEYLTIILDCGEHFLHAKI